MENNSSNNCMSCSGATPSPNCHYYKDQIFTNNVIEIDNPENLILFHKIVVPASLGDETTNPPYPGKYANVLMVYEANGHSYLYSSDGIPTALGFDSGGILVVDEFPELEQAATNFLYIKRDTGEAQITTDNQNWTVIAGHYGAVYAVDAQPDAADAEPDSLYVDYTTGDAWLTHDNVNWVTINESGGKVLLVDTFPHVADARTNTLYIESSNGEARITNDNTTWIVVASGGGGGGTNDFDVLVNRPKYAGQTMTSSTDIPDFSSQINSLSSSLSDEADAREQADLALQSAKQDKLVAGDNIQISATNVISATNTTYTAGDNIAISPTNEISAIIPNVYGFDTVADMKASTELKAGDYAITAGYYAKDDGGAATYEITGTGTANEMDVISVGSLFAHLVKSEYIKPETFGAYGDGTHDDTLILQYILDNYNRIEISKNHLIAQTLTGGSNKIIKGNGALILGGADFDLLYISGDNCVIDGLNFTNPNNYKSTDISVMPKGRAVWCLGDNNVVKNCSIDNYIAGIVFGNNSAGKTECKALNNRITNLNGLSTGWVNDGIMTFSTKCIIKNNFVSVKEGDNYSRAGICADIRAHNCIIDNNIVIGNDNVLADIHVEKSEHCMISNNQCFSPRSQGIAISSYSIVTGNYVETGNKIVSGYTLNISGLLCTSENNITLDNNTVVGRHQDAYGVYMSTGINNIVVNNRITGEPGMLSRGINLLTTTKSIISNNTISDNVVNNIGIAVSNGTGISITDNYIGLCNTSLSTSRGINLSICSSYKIENNTIDNYFIGINTDNQCGSGNINNNNIINTGTLNINTGISINTANTTDVVYVTNNYVQDASWRKINKSNNPNTIFISDYNQSELLDTQLNTVKKITVTNGVITVA